MRLPDGTILMHDAIHAYDPVKAHEYYMRTRKLKGRKKGEAEVIAPKPKMVGATSVAKKARAQVSKKSSTEAFLKTLPMVQEGASLQDAAKFVKSLRGKSDEQLRAQAAKIKKERGDMDGAQVATIEKLIQNRNRTRKTKRSKKEMDTQKANAAKRVSSLTKKLSELERELRKKMAEAKAAERKAKRGPTAAEKSKEARESKKYRDKNQQKLKTQSKAGGAKESAKPKKDSVAALQEEIAKTKGALAAAKERQQTLSKA